MRKNGDEVIVSIIEESGASNDINANVQVLDCNY